jgi:hypothetical protein
VEVADSEAVEVADSEAVEVADLEAVEVAVAKKVVEVVEVLVGKGILVLDCPGWYAVRFLPLDTPRSEVIGCSRSVVEDRTLPAEAQMVI